MSVPAHVLRGLLCAGVALLCVGCELLGEGTSGSIESDITFQVAEVHPPATDGAPRPPTLQFSMRTVEQFPCLGYQIEHTFDRSDARIVVRATGIDAPDGACATAIGPATAQRDLSLAPGTYTLVFFNGDQRDAYRLAVTAEQIEIAPQGTPQWTEPEARLFWRYPEDSFAFHCGTTEEATQLCTDFARRLQDLPLTPIEAPEEGVWPYKRQPDGYWVNAPSRFYRYSDEATWTAVKERLRQFTRERIQGRDGIGLEVRNWRDDRLASWMVE